MTQLSIAVPVYNESAHVIACLQRLREVAQHWPWTTEIIVVDDGSSDGSAELAKRWIQQCPGSGNDLLPPVQLEVHSVNRGKGAAIRTALTACQGEWMVVQDADLEYDPADIESLYCHAQSGGADVVYGSRCLPGSTNPRRYNLFAAGVSLLNLAVVALYRVRLTDEATCYKLFRTDDLRRMQLRCERFEFCPEVTAKACRMGLQISELPVRYKPRDHSQGKKITIADGWVALKTLWRFRRWTAGNDACPGRTAAAGSAVVAGQAGQVGHAVTAGRRICSRSQTQSQGVTG